MIAVLFTFAFGTAWIALAGVGSVLFLGATGLWAYLQLNPQFGGKISKEDIERFSKSKQWNGKIFLNRSLTDMTMKPQVILKLIRDRARAKAWIAPKTDIPVTPFDKAAFLADGSDKYIWYGHSVILLRIGGKTVFIDPMMSDDATAIAPAKAKRFSSGTLAILDQLPEIDVLCISHDHYDHLDYHSILKLRGKVKHYYVALGVGRHLQRWGIDSSQITEMDWCDTVQVDNLRLTFTESRHFSGRGLTDRFQSLWGGWIIASPDCKVYWSGDGGYDAHFKEIGAQYGPFDVGFMECGQYHIDWQQIHMLPEESVQAAQEAGVNLAVPVHCMGFALALHPWQEPHERFMKSAVEQGLPTLLPTIGAVMEIPSMR